MKIKIKYWLFISFFFVFSAFSLRADYATDFVRAMVKQYKDDLKKLESVYKKKCAPKIPKPVVDLTKKEVPLINKPKKKKKIIVIQEPGSDYQIYQEVEVDETEEPDFEVERTYPIFGDVTSSTDPLNYEVIEKSFTPQYTWNPCPDSSPSPEPSPGPSPSPGGTWNLTIPFGEMRYFTFDPTKTTSAERLTWTDAFSDNWDFQLGYEPDGAGGKEAFFYKKGDVDSVVLDSEYSFSLTKDGNVYNFSVIASPRVDDQCEFDITEK